jgi:hypothetical protein
LKEQAKRIKNYSDIDPSVICYWKHQKAGMWYISFPTDDEQGMLGGLALHTVEEHEDGTITVTPSIRTRGHNGYRHGYLTKGVWEGCEDDKQVILDK